MRKKGFRLPTEGEYKKLQLYKLTKERENKYKRSGDPYNKTGYTLFTYKYPKRKPDGMLLQRAISHKHQHIVIGATTHGGPIPAANNSREYQVWIDYIRVFQPRDKYAEFTPVYQ